MVGENWWSVCQITRLNCGNINIGARCEYVIGDGVLETVEVI